MVAYRRNFVPGGTYFFTVNLRDRNKSYLTQYVDDLRECFRSCKSKYPMTIDAVVILPEHLHCLWTLPSDDSNYANRWRYIKSSFTKKLIAHGVNITKDKHGQYNLWQRRYWEHTIRDEKDFNRHVEYIHYNPIKHGYVTKLIEWPNSSFHQYVKNGVILENWGENHPPDTELDRDSKYGE